VKEARKKQVFLVSANLTRADGTRPFEAHRLVEVGGARVGITGLWLPGFAPPDGLVAADPVATARAEAEALRKAGADLVVVLAHGTRVEALKVAAVEGVDLVIPAHEKRAWPAERPEADRGWVMSAGFEGRSVLHLDLQLGHPGPIVDGSAAGRARRELPALQAQLAKVEERIAGSKSAEEKQARARVLEDLRKRIEQLKVEAAMPVPTGKTFFSRQRYLSKTVPDDPAWAEKLRRIEEKYPSP
jgi:2',3'-cyclic-nucleotide 2'-phosphodiesterase (5'-nucleotidase family)